MLDVFRKIAEERYALQKDQELPEVPRPKVGFIKSLKAKGPRALILEHKRASPSEGRFKGLPSLQEVIASYEKQNAAALSVLTEEKKFLGSLTDLRQAAVLTELPLLRKDFLVSPGEVEIASAFGADAILIIVAMLKDEEIKNLLDEAKKFKLDALVEVHDQEELDRALKFPIELLGINNRNLKTLKTDTNNFLELLENVPGDIKVVAESGYNLLDDIEKLPARTLAVLAGTSFLRALCQKNEA
jgi:indole-3-glycerol phosphate synthase